MFDTHAHLNDKAFRNDIEGVLARAAEAGIEVENHAGSCMFDFTKMRVLRDV